MTRLFVLLCAHSRYGFSLQVLRILSSIYVELGRRTTIGICMRLSGILKSRRVTHQNSLEVGPRGGGFRYYHVLILQSQVLANWITEWTCI